MIRNREGPVPGRLAVVDDEPELLEALQDAISALGFEVSGFSTGAAALAALRSADFDIILTDLLMPGMNGIELFRRARGIDSHVVGIIMTGHATIQTAIEAMKGGMFDYIMKPFKMEALVPVLDRAISVRRLGLENLELRQTVAMYELGQTVSYSLALGTILDKVADGALQQCQADETSIMLLADNDRELYIAAVRKKDRADLLGKRVPLDSYVAGWVAGHREPLVLNGEVHDSRFSPAKPRGDIKLAVSLPMLVGGRLVGVLNLNFTHARRPLTVGEVKALNIFGSIAATALESARMNEKVLAASRFPEENPNPVMRLSREGVLLYANPATGPILEEWRCAVGQTVPTEYQALAGAVLASQVPAEADLTAEKRTFSAVFAPVVEAGYVNVYSLDTTEKRNLQQQLLQAQKMEAIGRLAGGVAHDFNNVLTAIIGYSDFLLMKLGKENPLGREVREIRKAGERAASLTHQLLAFSRKQIFEVKVLDLNAIVTGMEKMLRRLVHENISLELDLDPALGQVRADSSQMEQILLNLVVNASDAMPAGGKLLIETANAELDDSYSSMHMSVKAGPHIALVVSDTGIGMTPEIRDRVFEPFFTTKERGKGTGLGLSTVYGIVKQSGGNIWVYSESGKGTAFKIYLPRASGAVQEMPHERAGGELPKGTETILVVEDELMIREIISVELLEQGFTVLLAGGGEEALRISTAHEGAIHLLLTDVILPGMSGREIARNLTTSRPGIRVIYMSGYTENGIVNHGVLTEGIAFIQKPFSSRVLLNKVRQVLDAKVPPVV